MIIVFFILTNYYCKELISHQIEILIDQRSRFEQKRFEIFHHHICFIVDPCFGSGCGGEINSCRVRLVTVFFIKKCIWTGCVILLMFVVVICFHFVCDADEIVLQYTKPTH